MSAPLILVQDFYSLYIENCHVRHVFLAMSPASQYYSTLQLYNDDDYTRKKTSLVDPRGGFPSGLKLAFHTARFSSLKTISSNMTPISQGRTPAPGAEASPWVSSRSLEKSGPTSDLLGSIDGDSVADMTRLAGMNKPLDNKKALDWESEKGHYGPAPILAEWGNVAEEASSTSVNNHEWQQTSRHTDQRQLGRGRGRTPYVSALKANGINGHGSPAMQSRHEQRGVREFEGSWDDMPTNHKSMTEDSMPAQGRPPSAVSGSRAPSSDTSSRPDAAVSHMARSSQTSGATTSPMRTAAEPRGTRFGILGRPGSSSSSNESGFLLSTARGINGPTRKAFQSSHVRQRQPEPERRPISSPIALNKYDQRIDLQLPFPTGPEKQSFRERHSTHKLCNNYHLRGTCPQPEGRQCPYDHGEIDTSLYLQLRSMARLMPCANGPGCRDQTCWSGHHCPNVGSLRECGQSNCAFGRSGMHDTRHLEVVKMIDAPEVGS